MYLEISARQTGKSTRLINQIYFDKDKYDLQILMGMNYNHLKMIKENVKRNNKLKICCSFDSFKETILGYRNIRLYVDEFLYSTSFCNNFKEFKNLFYNVIQDGYYVSSINTNNERYSIFLELKELNFGLVNSMNVHDKFFV